MVNLSKDKKNQTQFAVVVSSYRIETEMNEWLGNGFTFVAQFSKYPNLSSNDHIIIFQKPHDNKTGTKNNELIKG